LRDGQIDPEEIPAYSELTRRLGFKYNGMVLHEHYFGNLKKGGSDHPDHNSVFYQAAEASFGRYALVAGGFHRGGTDARGGLGDLLPGPSKKRLVQPLGHPPRGRQHRWLLPRSWWMDVWEHAYLLDYQPAQRPKYIEAFFSNIDWDAVEQRLQLGAAARPVGA